MRDIDAVQASKPPAATMATSSRSIACTAALQESPVPRPPKPPPPPPPPGAAVSAVQYGLDSKSSSCAASPEAAGIRPKTCQPGDWSSCGNSWHDSSYPSAHVGRVWGYDGSSTAASLASGGLAALEGGYLRGPAAGVGVTAAFADGRCPPAHRTTRQYGECLVWTFAGAMSKAPGHCTPSVLSRFHMPRNTQSVCTTCSLRTLWSHLQQLCSQHCTSSNGSTTQILTG